jgi:hypothetical protein
MRQTHDWRGPAAALCGAVLLALALTAPLPAAPAPFAKAGKPSGRGHAALAGTWTLHWHGSAGEVRLSGDGSYRCAWCELTYVGTWKLAEGRVVITESYRPEDSSTWHTFAAEVGAAPSGGQPASVRLERAR